MVYSGILPICKDETGLATVLSHEIAHIVAGHLAEDASKRTVIGIASIPTWPTMILATFGIMFYGPFTLVALVWSGALGGAAMWSSRTRESEADFIGLVIMSRAGYDIRQAVKFWERMKNQTDADLAQKYGKGGKAAQEPELFSTHPHVREEYGFCRYAD
jgi:predicted Zn-dependent protease